MPHGCSTQLWRGGPDEAARKGLERGVADIFHEVDEEVRREQLKRLWERYSILIVALAVLIVAGIGGWRGYEYWVAQKAAAAGAAFEAAVTLSEQGKHAEAESAFAKIATDAPAGRTLVAVAAGFAIWAFVLTLFVSDENFYAPGFFIFDFGPEVLRSSS